MALYVFGDIHGPVEIGKLTPRRFPAEPTLTEEDYVVVCGDFGFPFLPTDVLDEEKIPFDLPFARRQAVQNRRAYAKWVDWLAQRPYQILFVDGNHDNHAFWNAQPVEVWNGGMINRLPDAPNVIHLRRGEYYTIAGKTFWAMGGASSIDREYRIEGYSWWPQELLSLQEMEHGLQTLETHGNQVDYILTHTLPRVLIPIYFGRYSFRENDPVSGYLDEVYRRVKGLKQWYCGHMHADIAKEGYRLTVLYEDCAEIS